MPRNPAHPWVGEAVALDFANSITGSLFSDGGVKLRWRNRAAYVEQGLLNDYVPMTAGDSFVAGFYESEMLLSGDAVVASFVVVCEGSGTLRLSGGTDPDWTLDDPGDATIPLGEFTVAPTDGTVELVGTLPSFDVDAYLAQTASTILLVECVSGGDVNVQQVRLRLWPPGGPVGGWAATSDPFMEPVAVQAHLVGQVNGPGDLTVDGVDTGLNVDGDPADAWNATRLELETLMQPDANRAVVVSETSPAILGFTVQAGMSVSEVLGGGEFEAYAEGRMGGVLVLQPDPLAVMRLNALGYIPGEYGVDFVHSPDEVPGDMPVKVLAEPTTAWDENATLATTDWIERPDGPGLGTYYHVTAWPDLQWWNPDEVILPLETTPVPNQVPTLGSSVALMGVTAPATLPDGQRLALISVSHDSFKPENLPDPYAGDPGYDRGVTAIVAATIGPSTVTIPPFQYWSPTAASAPAEPLRLRQRTDGLGLGSTRVRGTGSRQHSTRVRGYL